MKAPYRWRDWAAPEGTKRKQLEAGALGAFFDFVNGELIPHLKSLAHNPNATARQKIIGEALSGVERTRVDTEKNLLDVLDKVDALNLHAADGTHMFPLSQVYEGLLLKMGDKGNDGGQFFTPREVIRVIVRAIDPQPGQTIYDPCCGTGGFLAEAFNHVTAHFKTDATVDEVEALGTRTLFGREKEDLVYPLALANLMLHGVDRPHIWHGNTLTGGATYDGLWRDVPGLFDVVLTNPPFGGKEGKEAQSAFAYKTSATQILFLQHVIDSLAKGGRCGIVVDEGVLFRNNEGAFVQTKRRLGCLRPLGHRLPARRRLRQRGRGREDRFNVLHQGKAHRERLVLRPRRRKGRQEDAADAGPFRLVLRAAADPRRQRKELDGHPRRDRGEEFRPQSGQPESQDRCRSTLPG